MGAALCTSSADVQPSQLTEEVETVAQVAPVEVPLPPLTAESFHGTEDLFSLLKPLKNGAVPVALLRSDWILARADAILAAGEGGPTLALTRRQDMPPDAFYTADEVAALPRAIDDESKYVDFVWDSSPLGYEYPSSASYPHRAPRRSQHLTPSSHHAEATDADETPYNEAGSLAGAGQSQIKRPLRIVSISHAWLTSTHPDPRGQQLVAFAKAVRREQQRREPRRRLPQQFAIFYVHSRVSIPLLVDCSLGLVAHWSADRVAPEQDFCSLAQKERSPADALAFSVALSRMQLLYAHSCLTTFLLTEVPPGWPDAVPYG